MTAAWYLHTTSDGRLHLRNVQNLVARVTTTAGAYLRDQATKELKERLKQIFEAEEQVVLSAAPRTARSGRDRRHTRQGDACSERAASGRSASGSW